LTSGAATDGKNAQQLTTTHQDQYSMRLPGSAVTFDEKAATLISSDPVSYARGGDDFKAEEGVHAEQKVK
jgi:hypothetical protein